MKADLYLQVMQRSDGCCEAMIKLPRAWARCGRRPVEVHHALTKARGGRSLDSVGETYHLIALCRTHHHEVDNYPEESGLIIKGSAMTIDGRVIYIGPDEYLSAKYGRDDDDRGVDDVWREGGVPRGDLVGDKQRRQAADQGLDL